MMDEGMGWAIFGVSFIFIFMLLGILAESLRQKSKLARQQMLQKERLAAMEKGLPLPDWDATALNDDGARLSGAEAHERSKQWFRLVSLCVGMLLAFGGVGLLIAFNLGVDNAFEEISSVGVIPLMAGLGLLLFYGLTRKGPD